MPREILRLIQSAGLPSPIVTLNRDLYSIFCLYFPRKSGHIFLVVGYVKQVVFELFWRLIIE